MPAFGSCKLRSLYTSIPSILAAAGLFAVCTGPAVANPVSGRVIEVIDGDSVLVNAQIPGRLENTVEIRLEGVNAPELDGKCRKEKELARLAKRYLEDMILGARIDLNNLRPHNRSSRKDMVARIVLRDGTDISAGLIALGFGHEYDGGGVRSWCRGPE